MVQRRSFINRFCCCRCASRRGRLVFLVLKDCQGFVRRDALVDFDDYVREGSGGEEDFLVVWNLAEVAVDDS